jgi:hypothetical protein
MTESYGLNYFFRSAPEHQRYFVDLYDDTGKVIETRELTPDKFVQATSRSILQETCHCERVREEIRCDPSRQMTQRNFFHGPLAAGLLQTTD